MQPPTDLLSEAYQVLDTNDHKTYTQPAAELYPHQWLWDSCFTAIGLRHRDPIRAQSEILSLLKGQWQNGMLPNIIFSPEDKYATDRNLWRSWVSPFAPEGIATTGITQPPLVAEAVSRIGEKLSPADRRRWYKQVYPSLVKYHQWLYRERDPHSEGLVLLIHPWEIGMDNTPPWMMELHDHQLSWWIRAIKTSKLDYVIGMFRRDTKSIPIDERFATVEVLALFDIQRRLRRKAYAIDRILDHSMFAIEDAAFNAILIRNNRLLSGIAKYLKAELPAELSASMKKAEETFEQLWDPLTAQYYSRDFITHRLLKTPSIATLIALYAGCIPEERARALVHQMRDKHSFAAAYPVPSVPQNSSWFNALNYWQGPTWINTNWLIIDGLKRSGFSADAKALREATLAMLSAYGCYEYFNPVEGGGLGTPNFSWSAALAVDLCLNPIRG